MKTLKDSLVDFISGTVMILIMAYIRGAGLWLVLSVVSKHLPIPHFGYLECSLIMLGFAFAWTKVGDK